MGSFIKKPLLHIGDNSEEWVTEGVTYYLSDKAGEVRVPSGFKTDLASIPDFVPRFIADPAGKSRLAAIVHDYLCRQAQNRKDRVLADHVFLEAMKDTGVPGWRRWLMFSAVRMMTAIKRKFP